MCGPPHPRRAERADHARQADAPAGRRARHGRSPVTPRQSAPPRDGAQPRSTQSPIRAAIVGGALFALASPAGAQPVNHKPILTPVDQGYADVDPLGRSLRFIQRDIRIDTNFEHLYTSPAYPGKFLRKDGAITAVFDQSIYAMHRDDVYTVTPPNTVFHIGDPRPTADSVPMNLAISFQADPSQSLARSTAVPLAQALAHRVTSREQARAAAEHLSRRIEARPASRIALTPEPIAVAHPTAAPRIPLVPPSIYAEAMTDEPRRARRLAALAARAAGSPAQPLHPHARPNDALPPAPDQSDDDAVRSTIFPGARTLAAAVTANQSALMLLASLATDPEAVDVNANDDRRMTRPASAMRVAPVEAPQRPILTRHDQHTLSMSDELYRRERLAAIAHKLSDAPRTQP